MEPNQFEPPALLSHLQQILGVSDAEAQQCFKQAQFLTPKVGKFWHGDANAGLYLVMAGKVRLLDSADELIATLKAGESFGEFTLFPEAHPPYSVRASINLHLCVIPAEALSPLMARHPPLRERLMERARAYSTIHKIDSKSALLSIPAVEPKLNLAYFPHPNQRVRHIGQIVRRYPFFAQQSASDCGAACLVMVGRYWGKRFSINRLRDMANVDRNRASLRGLAAAAESLGFDTRPVKASLDQLAQRLPAIAHWEGKHYSDDRRTRSG